MNKKGKINRFSEDTQSFHVPKDNILDLRSVQKKREQNFIQKNESFWTRVKKNFKKPEFKMPKQSLEKRVQEKVIVSESLKQGKKFIPKPKISSAYQPDEQSPQDKILWWQLSLDPSWYKKVVIFVLACVIITIPFYSIRIYQNAQEAKGKVLGISAEAYENLKQAGDLASSADFDSAEASFSRASQNFIAAQEQLGQVGQIILTVTKLVPGQSQSAQNLLQAGQSLSRVGSLLSNIVTGIESININPDSDTPTSSSSSLTEYLMSIQGELGPIQQEFAKASSSLDNVREKDLPDEYKESIAQIKTVIPIINDNFNNFVSLSDVILEILGKDSPKRYLLMFQNNRELRPTGGFIGSIALVDIYKGKIKDIEVPGGGVYDIAGQLQEKIVAPKPLWLVNPHWNIQDANWFADFPTSAQKIMWFFERTGRTTVDGVISLTPMIIEDLLDITGPIEMTDYGVVVNSGNFVRQAMYWAEVSYDREENQPKKFIGDLLPILMDRVFQIEPDKAIQVLDTMSRSLSNRNLLLYFSDESILKSVNEYSWDGALRESDKDYLYVVNTNIAGGKTDHVIDQFVEHQAEIQSDGSIINTVTVTRAHNGNELDRWEGSANVNYLRFYVPQGSTLLGIDGYFDMPAFRFSLPDVDAEQDPDLLAIEQNSLIDEPTGTRITTEFDYTVFGNWQSIDPGEVKKMTVKYKLPFKLDMGGLFSKTDTYSLLVQKQPGLENNFFSSTVHIPNNFEPEWVQTYSQSNGSFEYLSDLDSDKYLGILLRK